MAKPLFAVVLTLCMVLMVAGCSTRRQESPYVQSLVVTPATPEESLFLRLERAFRRRDLEVALDCLDRWEYESHGLAETKLIELFRRGDEVRLILRAREEQSAPLRGGEHEIEWRLSWIDIYTDNQHLERGRAFIVTTPGPVPRIAEIRGDDFFLP